MKSLFILILIPLLLQAKELETCYRIYFWFLPVAESCVDYQLRKESLKIRSWAKTIVVGRIVKRVNSWGEAELVNLEPKKFALFQREGDYIRDHLYNFLKKGVDYRIVRYKNDKKVIKEGFFESPVYLFDPFSTSFMVYIDTPNFAGGVVNMFYDAKIQNVRYKTLGDENVEVFERVYDAWKVLLIPEIETKGLLKPKGRWYIWIDKNTNIPVKLLISFTIGSAKVLLEKIKGDKTLFLEVKNGQAGILQGTFR